MRVPFFCFCGLVADGGRCFHHAFSSYFYDAAFALGELGIDQQGSAGTDLFVGGGKVACGAFFALKGDGYIDILAVFCGSQGITAVCQRQNF